MVSVNGKKLTVNLSEIPELLRQYPNWCVWRYERGTKVPYCPAAVLDKAEHARAASNSPITWSDFETACKALALGFDGLGFFLDPENLPVIGFDYDHCVIDGEIEERVKREIRRLDTYTEISPSGHGVRILALGSIPPEVTGRKCAEVEIYDRLRFLTITGDRIKWASSRIEKRQEAVEFYCHKYFPPTERRLSPVRSSSTSSADEEILRLASTAANGEKFSAYWSGDASRISKVKADGSMDNSAVVRGLLEILKFWTQDHEQLDRLMRLSPLVSNNWADKWERLGEREIASVLAQGGEFYSGDDGIEEMSPTCEIDSTPRPESKSPEMALVDRIRNLPDAPAKFERPKRRSYSLDEIDEWPEIKFLVESHLPENSFAEIYGNYGTCKSFYALELALSVATGKKFLGEFDVRTGPVCYVAGEGKAGLKQRLKAWRFWNDVQSVPNFRLIDEPFNLCDADEAEKLLEILAADFPTMPKLIVVDTLARNFIGNENDGEDMGKFVASVDLIRSVTGAAVLVLHHSGKDSAKKSRGHTSLPGALDAAIELRSDGEAISVRCEKQKDAGEFPEYLLDRVDIDLGQGDKGQRVGSLVLKWSGYVHELRAADRDRVLEAIPYDASITYQQLAEALGETLNGAEARNRYKAEIARLEKRGAIVVESSGGVGRGSMKTFKRQ